MNYRISILIILMSLGISCKESHKKGELQEQASTNTHVSIQHFMEAEELPKIKDHKNSIKVRPLFLTT